MKKGKLSIGKVIALTASVLTIIALLFELYNYITKESETLSASIKSTEFQFPSILVGDVMESLPRDIIDSIFALRARCDTSMKQLDRLSHFAEFINSKITHPEVRNFGYYHYFWIIEISNPGNIPVSSISIDVNRGGYYRLISEEDSVKESLFGKNIIVGNLRPQNKAKVYIWADDPADYRNVKINYSTGFIYPKKINDVSGFYAWVTKYSPIENLFLRIIPFSLLVYYVFSFIKWLRSYRNKAI